MRDQTKRLISFFVDATCTHWRPSNEIREQLANYLSDIDSNTIRPTDELKLYLIELINERLDLNKKWYRYFIDNCAENGVIFNYHQKMAIECIINKPKADFLQWALQNLNLDSASLIFAEKVEKNRNKELNLLDQLLVDDKNAKLVIESIFCSLVYHYVPEVLVHKKLNPDCNKFYESEYWNHLVRYHSLQINRNNGLYIINLDEIYDSICSYEGLINRLFSLVRKSFNEVTNHCYLAIIIGDKIKEKWNIISDLTIFAEKFIEREIRNTYFRRRDIEKETKDYIPNIDVKEASFNLGNEGFAYKDCYITYIKGREYCVLLFEKNEKDERPVPCPKCRTFRIQGNSYPIIGVRSWECKNIFCGDKSKYNRGKRYSLASIIRQQAILDDRNIIDNYTLKKWRRDIVEINNKNEIIEMLCKLYSLTDDRIIYFGQENSYLKDIHGRKINIRTKNNFEVNENEYRKYENLHFFKRFLINRPETSHSGKNKNLSEFNGLELYNGDAFHVLSKLPENSIDGAITSPPYYNAKDYSSWKNIYCYLYDMFNIAKKTHKCLKKGAPYLFNIFDYFDNERNIVFSDMGKKRMILSSYISYIFRKIGFLLIRNIPWDKGEIEGNRNYNQGNLSPYYQAPHNCWEHVLVFSKDIPKFDINKLPDKLEAKPVFKFKNGLNMYGHSAPFPKELPDLLLNLLDKGGTVLDPFSGSMTTGRTAYLNGYKSINIEIHKEYCDLSLRLLKEDIKRPLQLSLFK